MTHHALHYHANPSAIKRRACSKHHYKRRFGENWGTTQKHVCSKILGAERYQ